MEKAVTKAMMNALKNKKKEGENCLGTKTCPFAPLHTMAAEKKEASNSLENCCE